MNVVLQSPPLPFSSQPWPLPVSITALSVIRSHTLSGDLLPVSASASWSLLLEDVKGNFQLTFFWIFWQLLVLKVSFPAQQSCCLHAPRAPKHRLQTHPSVLSEARHSAQFAPRFSSLLKPVHFWLFLHSYQTHPPLFLYQPLICQGSLMGPHTCHCTFFKHPSAPPSRPFPPSGPQGFSLSEIFLF